MPLWRETGHLWDSARQARRSRAVQLQDPCSALQSGQRERHGPALTQAGWSKCRGHTTCGSPASSAAATVPAPPA